MQLVPVDTPRVLPEFAACYSAHLVDGDRSVYFAAGRYCAAQAIRQLGGDSEMTEVGRGQAGEPIWPPGLTGSITHKDDFFSVAVARTSDARSIGLDAERIIETDRAERISRLVVLPQETSVGGDSLAVALRVTLVFSIKEAVFKCLYPLVLRRFYYDAVAVTAVDVQTGTFQAALKTSLGDRFQAGQMFPGRFAWDPRRVYAGIFVPAHPLREGLKWAGNDHSV